MTKITQTWSLYTTPAAQRVILRWLGKDRSKTGVESTAYYMSKTLRIGGITACRKLILAALEAEEKGQLR